MDVFLSNGVEATRATHATLYTLAENIVAGLEGQGGRRAPPQG